MSGGSLSAHEKHEQIGQNAMFKNGLDPSSRLNHAKLGGPFWWAPVATGADGFGMLI